MQQLELFEHSDATDCSIDIETLDTTPSSVILSIGAVFFHKDTVYGESYLEISIQDQLKLQRTISAATLHWWTQQNEKAMRVFHSDQKLTLAAALAELSTCYKLHPKVERVWAKGPSFDLSILDHAYHQLDLVPPWRYSQHRDIRTLQYLAECCKLSLRKPGEVSHNALDDAKAQAALVSQFHEGVQYVSAIKACG